MRVLVNEAVRPEAVASPAADAAAFHASIDGYRPTPVRDLAWVAGELGLAKVGSNHNHWTEFAARTAILAGIGLWRACYSLNQVRWRARSGCPRSRRRCTS